MLNSATILIKFIKKSDRIISPEQTAYEAYPGNCHVPWDDISDHRKLWWKQVVDAVIIHNLPSDKHEFRLHPFLAKDQGMVLSGVDLGADARIKFKLDDIPPYESIGIVIPDSVISLNRSFFKGLFEPTITKYGLDNFKTQFTFYSINQAILEDIYCSVRRYETSPYFS